MDGELDIWLDGYVDGWMYRQIDKQIVILISDKYRTTYVDCRYVENVKPTFRHIGYNDTNQKDDGIQPMVAEDEGNDEEGDTKEDSDTSDQVDEMVNLLGDGCVTSLKSRGKTYAQNIYSCKAT